MVQGPKSRYICLGGWEQTMPAAQLVAPILRLSGKDGILRRPAFDSIRHERLLIVCKYCMHRFFTVNSTLFDAHLLRKCER
jgi:hypothetical protein